MQLSTRRFKRLIPVVTFVVLYFVFVSRTFNNTNTPPDPVEEKSTSTAKSNKISAAIVYFMPALTLEEDLEKITISLRHLFQNLNLFGGYPVYIYVEHDNIQEITSKLFTDITFNDPKNNVGTSVRLDSIHALPINLDFPSSIKKSRVSSPIYMDNWPISSHIMQTRFSTLFQQPQLEEFDYVLHLSNNLILKNQLEYDPFELMRKKNWKYVYVNSNTTRYDQINLLWNLAEKATKFQDIHGRNLSRFDINGVKFPIPLRMMDTDMLNYDTDFEILHLPTFKKRAAARNMVNLITKSKGIYEYNWPVNALRWLTVQFSLNTTEEVGMLCDVETEKDGVLNRQQCEYGTGVNFRELSPYHYQKLVRSKELAAIEKDKKLTMIKVANNNIQQRKVGGDTIKDKEQLPIRYEDKRKDFVDPDLKKIPHQEAPQKLNDNLNQGDQLQVILQNQKPKNKLLTPEQLQIQDEIQRKFIINQKNRHDKEAHKRQILLAENQKNENTPLNNHIIKQVVLRQKEAKDPQEKDQHKEENRKPLKKKNPTKNRIDLNSDIIGELRDKKIKHPQVIKTPSKKNAEDTQPKNIPEKFLQQQEFEKKKEEERQKHFLLTEKILQKEEAENQKNRHKDAGDFDAAAKLDEKEDKEKLERKENKVIEPIAIGEEENSPIVNDSSIINPIEEENNIPSSPKLEGKEFIIEDNDNNMKKINNIKRAKKISKKKDPKINKINDLESWDDVAQQKMILPAAENKKDIIKKNPMEDLSGKEPMQLEKEVIVGKRKREIKKVLQEDEEEGENEEGGVQQVKLSPSKEETHEERGEILEKESPIEQELDRRRDNRKNQQRKPDSALK